MHYGQQQENKCNIATLEETRQKTIAIFVNSFLGDPELYSNELTVSMVTTSEEMEKEIENVFGSKITVLPNDTVNTISNKIIHLIECKTESPH